MADCECLGTCLFFNDKMPQMPALSSMYKKTYCTGDNEGCARHMIARTLGRPRVPPDLYPNQTDRAKKIIAQG